MAVSELQQSGAISQDSADRLSRSRLTSHGLTQPTLQLQQQQHRCTEAAVAVWLLLPAPPLLSVSANIHNSFPYATDLQSPLTAAAAAAAFTLADCRNATARANESMTS